MELRFTGRYHFENIWSHIKIRRTYWHDWNSRDPEGFSIFTTWLSLPIDLLYFGESLRKIEIKMRLRFYERISKGLHTVHSMLEKIEHHALLLSHLSNSRWELLLSCYWPQSWFMIANWVIKNGHPKTECNLFYVTKKA